MPHRPVMQSLRRNEDSMMSHPKSMHTITSCDNLPPLPTLHASAQHKNLYRTSLPQQPHFELHSESYTAYPTAELESINLDSTPIHSNSIVPDLDHQINIFRPLSTSDFSELMCSPDTSSLPTTSPNTMIVLQRGSTDRPYLRLFWQENDSWHQRAPFTCTPLGGTEPTSMEIARDVSRLKEGGIYKVKSAVYQAVKVHPFQFVLVKIAASSKRVTSSKEN
ncbi:hypothetical protein HDU98_001390 [Podochytrium sp. JEL0797]|nr:hypothetical protein HDU98_001390 [Podochytrium sp. JEL0797]